MHVLLQQTKNKTKFLFQNPVVYINNLISVSEVFRSRVTILLLLLLFSPSRVAIIVFLICYLFYFLATRQRVRGDIVLFSLACLFDFLFVELNSPLQFGEFSVKLFCYGDI